MKRPMRTKPASQPTRSIGALPGGWTWLLGLVLVAGVTSGCFSRSLDKGQAESLLKVEVEKRQLTYTLFLGPRSCPKGCADCRPGAFHSLAMAEDWVTAECIDGTRLQVEPTEAGKRVLARQPEYPQANGEIMYRIVIGHGELYQVNQPEQQGSGRASVSYSWAYRPSATAMELLANGPREIAKTTWRLCGTDRKRLSRDPDCAMGFDQGSNTFYWDSQKGGWAPVGGGTGSGMLGPR